MLTIKKVLRRQVLIPSIVVIVTICCLGCDIKQRKQENASKNSDNIPKSVTVDSFIGNGGYIIENQLWDYSEMFDTVYEWAEGIKMPIEKIKNSKVHFEHMESEEDSRAVLALTNWTEESLNEYKESMKKNGYSVYEDKGAVQMYKDGIFVCFAIDEGTIYPYITVGNVSGKRNVTEANVRELIEKNGLLKSDKYYSNYCVIAIDNKSISEKGYYEFLILSERTDDTIYNMSYYLITDGEEVNLFEKNLYSIHSPSTANMTEDELVFTAYRFNTDDENSTFVVKYDISDKKFTKRSEEELEIGVAVMGKIESGECILYRLKNNDKGNFPIVGRDMWIIDKMY